MKGCANTSDSLKQVQNLQCKIVEVHEFFRMVIRHRTLGECEIQEILADSASESEAEIEGEDEEEFNYEDMEADEPEETSINFSASIILIQANLV